MIARTTRLEWPAALAAFLLGVVVSGAAAALYVLALTGGGGESTVLSVDSLQVREREGGRGEIAIAERSITERLEAAKVPTQRITGGIGIRAGNIVWTDGVRRPFLRAQRAAGTINVDAAEHGNIVVDNVGIADAHVLLDQQSTNGEWNYERVLSEILNDNSPPSTPARVILLRNVTIANSNAEVHQPSRNLEFQDIDGALTRVQFSGPNLPDPEIDVRHADATYVDLNKKQELQIGADNAHLTFPERRVTFTVANANVGGNKLSELSGNWRPSEGALGLTIAGRARDVAFADLAFLSDRLPRNGGGSFRFMVRPAPRNEMEVRLYDGDVHTEGSHILGAVAVRTAGQTFELLSVDAKLDPLALDFIKRVSGRELPYGGTVTGTVRGRDGELNFAGTANLTAEGVSKPFSTDLTGLATFRGGTFALRDLTAKLDHFPMEALKPVVPNLPFQGEVTGTVALHGPPNKAPLNLNVRLDVAGGVAQVEGTLDLTGAQPAYDLSGQLLGLSLQKLLARPAPPALLTARFTLNGRGSDPKTADARVGVMGRFTEWRAQPHDTVAIAAQVHNGAVSVETGIVYLGPLHVEAAGQWRFVAPETGALTYHVLVEDLAALAPYVPMLPDSAAGKLDGRGSIAGSLDRMRVDGTMTGQNVKVMRWTAATIEGKYQAVVGPAVPEINIQATAKDIATPADGTYSTATVSVKLMSPVFALDVRATRPQGGGLEVVANGSIPYEGARHIDLQRAVIDTETGQWSLTHAARVDWGGTGGVRVTNFEMKNNTSSGLVRVNGLLFPLANIDARIETVQLPVDIVQRLMGREPIVTGLLTTTTNIRGPGTAPTFDIDFTLDNGKVRSVPFSRLQGKFNYAGLRLAGNAVVTFDTAGTAELRAALPMQVAFSPKVLFNLLSEGPVDASLVTDSIALGPFALLFPELRDVTGHARADAHVTGTVANPNLSGTIYVINGALTPIIADRRYTDINAEIVFTQRSAEIRKLHAFSGGPLDATGRIDFPSLRNPEANIKVTLDKFRPAGVDAHPDAYASGTINIAGPLSSPVVNGAVSIGGGDIPVPTTGNVGIGNNIADFGGPDDFTGTQPMGIFSRVTLDNFKVTVETGTWFNLGTSRAQLAGTLTINKHENDLRVLGTLEGTRGTYTLEAGPIVRRFEITHAEVRFRGEAEINPALDITARRVMFDASGRQMDIEVRVGGTLQSPTLALASDQATAIPQSELLSFLLFGQANPTLGAGTLPGEALVQETLVGGIAELATLEIENAIGAPFDIFQLRLGGGQGLLGLEQSSLVVGREITPNVFLTVESGISAIFGSGETNAQNFAIRLEWRVDRWTTVRAGYEPADRTRLFRGLDVLQISRPRQQGSIEIRRRWQW